MTIRERKKIIEVIRLLSKNINQIANKHGFWDGYSFGDKIALTHTELSEAFEAHRHGNPKDEHIPHHKAIVVELADAIIRILDMAEEYEYPIAEAMLDKIEFNETRPYKHGKRL